MVCYLLEVECIWFSVIIMSNQIWELGSSKSSERWLGICFISCDSSKVCISSIRKIWSYTMSSIVFIKNSYSSFVLIYKVFNEESWWPSCEWRSLCFSSILYISSLHESNGSTRTGRISIWTIDWMSIIRPTYNWWVLCW